MTAETFFCHPFCATCSGNTANSCLSCSATAFFNDTSKSCYCMSAEYLKVVPGCTTSPCSTCAKCIAPCKNCFFDNEISCLSCVTEFFYAVNATTCVLQCPPMLYVPNAEKMICMDCVAPCLYCLGRVDNCTACVKDYFYDFENFTCKVQCNVGYYGDTESWECRSCDLSCVSCIGPFSTNCTLCNYTFFNSTLVPSVLYDCA